MANPTLSDVKIDDLKLSMTESQCARRDSFNQSELDELAESIKEVGVLQPIVVRIVDTKKPVPGEPGKWAEGLEIVAGERRYLAAAIAGLVTIPALVHTDMNSAMALQVQLTENLQREGLHPMQEAEGYEQLKAYGHSVEEIYEMVGKSRAYVFNRLKLLQLSKAARKAYLQDKITTSVALALCRVESHKHQNDALSEFIADDDTQVTKAYALEYIKDNYLMVLKEAPFDTNDEKLLKGVPSCAACPKRTGQQAELFQELKGNDCCTDPTCYAAKKKAHGRQLISAAKKNGQTVITGAEAKALAPLGLDHWRRNNSSEWLDAGKEYYQHGCNGKIPRKAMNKTEWENCAKALVQDSEGNVREFVKTKDVAKVMRAKKAAKKPEGKQPDPVDADRKARKEKAKLEQAYRIQLYKEIREGYTITPNPEWIAEALLAELDFDLELIVCEIRGHTIPDGHMGFLALQKELKQLVKNSKADGDSALWQFITDMVIVSEFETGPFHNASMPKLKQMTKELKINTAAVRKAVREKLQPAPKKAPAKKKVAAKRTSK